MTAPRLAARSLARPRRDGWDLLQVALTASLLFQIWRVQDLFPVFRAAGLPIAVSLATLFVFLVDHDRRRKIPFRTYRVLRIAIWTTVLVVLSIPGSLYPGGSFQFLIKDYWRSVALLLLIAGSVRSVDDLVRLAWVQVAGATLFCGVVLSRFSVGQNGRLGELVMYDSNDLAAIIVCTVPLIVYLLWRARSIIVRGFLVV